MSCTKSFTSACIGIAIEHLLTMSSGLAWDEWSAAHGTSANDIDRLYFECEDTGECGYAYSWWTNELSRSGDVLNMYRAKGWGGQAIIVLQELDMVVVLTVAPIPRNHPSLR
jgi:CubicO group peptidase (beta-lactamase class C family)